MILINQRPVRIYLQLQSWFRCDDQREKLIGLKTTRVAFEEVSIVAPEASVTSEQVSISSLKGQRMALKAFLNGQDAFVWLQHFDFTTGSAGSVLPQC